MDRSRKEVGENVWQKKRYTCYIILEMRNCFVYRRASHVALLWPACLHLLQSRIRVVILLGLNLFLLGLSDDRGLGGGIVAPALKSKVSMSGIGKIVPEYVKW